MDDLDTYSSDEDAPGPFTSPRMMAGLVDAEVAVSSDVAPGAFQRASSNAANTAADVVRQGGVIASTTEAQLLSDFDPMFFVKTHPMSFPYGAGGLPQKMGLATYARIILERRCGCYLGGEASD